VFSEIISPEMGVWDQRPFISLSLGFDNGKYSLRPLYLRLHNYRDILPRGQYVDGRERRGTEAISRVSNGDPNKTITESLILANWPATSFSNIFCLRYEAVYDHICCFTPGLPKSTVALLLRVESKCNVPQKVACMLED
jgi:hypothetical protein